MRDDLAIAETPEMLTPEWLSAALGVDVRSVDVRPLGTGQMCDSVRVTFRRGATTDSDDGRETLIAKLPAADQMSRTTAMLMRSYEKEVRFYELLADALPVSTPRLHYADIDVATGAFVLLLEDRAPAAAGDQLAGCGVEEATVAVRELVGLHAPRWDDPSLDDLLWLRNDDPDGRAMMTVMLPMLWDGFQERYGNDVERHVRAAGDILFPNVGSFMELPADARTITHGDYRLDNLLFGPADAPGAPITVVDWQTCAIGAAMSDVAYFIGAGLTADDRRRSEQALVADYHDRLVAAGVDTYGWDRCWHDYRRGAWAGLLMAVGAAMMVARTERGDRMFLTMASRHSRHALDLDAADTIT